MVKHIPLLLSLFLVGFFWSAPAMAQATRTWVSGVGDDANPCSRTAPCKTFAGAIAKTQPGGEIDVLDPGGFGALTITKAITIDGTSAMAGVLVAGTNGITVNAGATDVVILRNLFFNGLGNSPSGVALNTVGTAYIDNCFIQGFHTGIAVGTTNAGTSAVYINGTNIVNNSNAIQVTATNAPTVVLQNSYLTTGTMGFEVVAGSSTQATVSNSAFVGFTGAGLSVDANAVSTQVNLTGTTFAQNSVGVQAQAGTVRLSDVLTSQNSNALLTGGGSIYSFGNNTLNAGNINNGATSYVIPLQ